MEQFETTWRNIRDLLDIQEAQPIEVGLVIIQLLVCCHSFFLQGFGLALPLPAAPIPLAEEHVHLQLCWLETFGEGDSPKFAWHTRSDLKNFPAGCQTKLIVLVTAVMFWVLIRFDSPLKHPLHQSIQVLRQQLEKRDLVRTCLCPDFISLDLFNAKLKSNGPSDGVPAGSKTLINSRSPGQG